MLVLTYVQLNHDELYCWMLFTATMNQGGSSSMTQPERRAAATENKKDM